MGVAEKNSKAKIVLIVCIIIACFFRIFTAWRIWTDIQSQQTVYTDFDKKRISEIEDTFGITITDDVILEKYYDNVLASIGMDGMIILEIVVNDYQKFMENNISAEIQDYEEYDNGGKLYARFKYNKDNYEILGTINQVSNTEYKIGLSPFVP